MAMLPWIWLTEASELIAERLARDEPGKFVATAALAEARKQVLDRAYRGVLEIQGKRFQIEEEPSVQTDEWIPIGASNWFLDLESEVTIEWDTNSLCFDDVWVGRWGYGNLRVRSEDIDKLWPGATDDNREQPSPLPKQKKNPGGAPRKFRDDLLFEIIRIADLDGLPDDKSELEKRLKDFNAPSWDPDDLPSSTTIYNIVREVYSKVHSET